MLLLGGILYPALPEQMAVHWNASDETDGTAASRSRSWPCRRSSCS
ncbi:DUF1648 domain-containing protein [Halapricum hydrolyticum]|uniref:DUF1648 domain-containing protein n=1 Tax=Halapricum hydrolyticum TaxID=2979991 RepID=A0AAE3I9N4_9EURY|nr:DUF1648 domain-containing protein [Halapricum hydrolyticum]MCU4725947.1 DUF1648 domain-containing protein [Halapricum hydrolyticum]